MNGFDYILLFFDRIYQSSLRFALARRVYWIFILYFRPASCVHFGLRDEIKNTQSPAARQVIIGIKSPQFIFLCRN